MSGSNNGDYRYLNRDGGWPGFSWHGLEPGGDGALRLASLPLFEGELPAELVSLPEPAGSEGLAVGPDGELYWGDAAGNRIFRRDACDGSVAAVPCVGDGRRGGAELSRPRALLVHPERPALVVADSGSHRLQLFDLDTFQLLDVWGGPGSAPGLFDGPWSLAADADGNLYVVDRGNRRVQKFDLRGRLEPEFWQTAAAAGALDRPTEVSVARTEDRTEIFVLDPGQGEIVVFDDAGRHRRSLALPAIDSPVGFLVHGDSILVGDNGHRRLLRLDRDGALVGQAVGYEGPVAALAAETAEGSLWLHPGAGAEPVRLGARGGFIRSGLLWGGPIGAGDRARAWHRLRALGSPLDSGAHFRLFVYASDGDVPPPAPDPSAPRPFDESIWDALAPDVPDVLAGSEPRPEERAASGRPPSYNERYAWKHLWIGAHFAGEGRQSPLVEQIRVDFDHTTYVRHLPGIYVGRVKGADPEPLERFLSLFESFFVDVEGDIAVVGRLADPAAVPAEWLDWLASWLALRLEEDWPEEKRRRVVARAFEAYAWRGTARGLRAALRAYTGVDAVIEEPLAQTGWWSLPPPGDQESPAAAASVLGCSTVLVPSEAQGAVLGTTAILDRSDLIRQEDLGAPLFEETAHRFSVELYPSQVGGAEGLARIRALIEQEKPAHTDYHLCLIEPRLRVGFQARLGVDTLLGGGPVRPTAVGEEAGGLTLGGVPQASLGRGTRVGTTRVEATVTFESDCTQHGAQEEVWAD